MRVLVQSRDYSEDTILISYRRAGVGQRDRLRRDCRFAGDLSNAYIARRVERRAAGVGADGFAADQRRQRGGRGQSAPSAWRVTDG